MSGATQYFPFFLTVFTLSFVNTVAATEPVFDDVELSNKPLVSPTRLQQPLRDIPASVTVIDEYAIKTLGFREIAEVLRLVPGMAVGQASGNDYRISYHGGNGLVPRRMQVLIDGMPIYQAGYARVDWKNIGISIADVARIEVTRSPSSATYGANAFNAVINIVTKPTALTQGIELRQDYTTRDAHESYARYGSVIGNTHYRVSVSARGDSGYDNNAAGADRRDGSDLKLFNFSSHTAMDHASLDVAAGVANGDNLVEFADSRQISFPDSTVHNGFVDMNWNGETSSANSLKVTASYVRALTRQDWQSCYPLFLETDAMRALAVANPDYALAIVNRKQPSGGTAEDAALYQAALNKIRALGASAQISECGSINQNQIDESFLTEVQDTYVVDKNLRYAVGLGNRHNRFESKTYVNGTVRNDDTYLFGTAEYIWGSFVFNIGTMAEYQHHYTDGVEFSPRAAINYRIDDRQTLKFIVSRALRTPDALENDRDWSYYVSNFTVPFDGKTSGYFFYRALSTEQLKSEKILSKEISYFANFPDHGVTLDIKAYREELEDLISEKLQFLDYHPTNDGWLNNTGAEIEVHYRPDSRWIFGVTYAYQDSDTNNAYERMLYARHSGSFYAIWSATSSINMSAAYFSSSSIAGFPYDRLDIGAEKTWSPHLSTHLRVSRLATQSGYIVDYQTHVLNRDHSLYEATVGATLSF